jgi:tyrosyl-tRNA synthetase
LWGVGYFGMKMWHGQSLLAKRTVFRYYQTMKISTDKDKIHSILARGIAEIIDREDLKKKLESGKKLRVKLGIDPTSPKLHIGRAVNLLKLRDFQDLGHQVVFIVGDFTGLIGDTSDKDSERPMLDAKTIKKNMKDYLAQAGKILDLKKVEFHHNSEWLKKLTYAEIGEQANLFSVAEFTARENIRKRLDAGKRVSLREMIYPLMQGYDSVMVKADVELGGTDQRFNLLAGRTMQPHYKQAPQNIVMSKLILGTDGRKMSSSWGNTINLTDTADDMFGKVMSIPDDLIIEYFEHCTRVPMTTVYSHRENLKSKKTNPRDMKLDLAFEIARLYHDEKKTAAAREKFISTFSKKETPTDAPKISMKKSSATVLEILQACFKGARSGSELRRVIQQGGARFNDEVKKDAQEKISLVEKAITVKVGKRNWFSVSV